MPTCANFTQAAETSAAWAHVRAMVPLRASDPAVEQQVFHYTTSESKFHLQSRDCGCFVVGQGQPSDSFGEQNFKARAALLAISVGTAIRCTCGCPTLQHLLRTRDLTD